MNIDERIEALTHRVELLLQMRQDNEKRHVRYFETISQSLQKLTQIVESHERRISDPEQRP